MSDKPPFLTLLEWTREQIIEDDVLKGIFQGADAVVIGPTARKGVRNVLYLIPLSDAEEPLNNRQKRVTYQIEATLVHRGGSDKNQLLVEHLKARGALKGLFRRGGGLGSTLPGVAMNETIDINGGPVFRGEDANQTFILGGVLTITFECRELYTP